jgi:hypothetical protein
LTEFVRFNALVFTTCVLPALALVAVRRRHEPTWPLAVAGIAYFAVIYIQSWASLHQFTPATVLPLVVFWRRYLDQPARLQGALRVALTLLIVTCAVLSLPRHFQTNQAAREVGSATALLVGDYERDYERMVHAASGFYALFREDYRLDYPRQTWGTDSLSLTYYATRAKTNGSGLNYVLQTSDRPRPHSMIAVYEADGLMVYVRDLSLWEEHKERNVRRVVVSPLYEPILRHMYDFFRAWTRRP